MNYTDLDLSILKAIITNKKCALDFVSECDAKLFSTDVWNFSKLLISYIKAYKDIPTLRVLEDQLSKSNNDKQIEYVKNIWSKISDFSYDDKQFKFDLSKLKTRYAEKQISAFQDNLIKNNSNKIDIARTMQELQKVSQSIKDLDNNKNYESKSIKEYLPTFVEMVNAKKKNPELATGILTKYAFFDFASNGVRGADFILVVGESGFGKSLLLNNIGVQIWMQDNTIDMVDNFTKGHSVIYFSLEMPYEDCFNRLISRMSGVPTRAIELGKFNKEEFKRIKKCLDFIKNYPHEFRIVDIQDACSNDLETILTEADVNFEVVVIDYLGIMRTNEKSNEADWLKQGEVAYETRAIARRHNLPVFSAAQLNRKAPGKDGSNDAGLHRLARSGTIATHTTHVIQIMNRQNEDRYPDFLCELIKCRKGPKTKGSLIKNLACATLLDQPVADDPSSGYDNYFTDQDDISEDMEDLEL